MFDSVFSKFTNFDYFPNDKLILGEKKVIQDLNNAESKGVELISKIPLDAVKNLEQDPDKVRQYLKIQLERSLYAIWLTGWSLGGNHADIEIKKPTPKKAEFSSKLIYFVDGRDKPGVSVRPIRNTPAERAIRGRISQLADDITNSEYKRIQQDLLAAVTPQGEKQQPISRNELLKRIEETLGTKSGRFKKRAETIARTELTFAYNAGRLETYRESGLVEAVRFYTILDERRCDICASRHGLVVPLDDWRAIAQNTPPLHPNCRCVLSPVLKDNKQLKEDDRKIENRELVPRPLIWAGAAILAAVLLGSMAKKSGVIQQIGNAIDDGKNIAAAVTLSEAIEEIRQGVIAENKATPDNKTTQSQTEEQPQSEEEKQEEQPEETQQTDTQFLVGGIDLNTATREQIQALLPARLLNVRQINEILRYRKNNRIDSVEDLKKIPEIGRKTLERLIQLSQDFDPVMFLNDVRSPAQLWASNLGLTRSQARTVFEELQKAPFKNIEDMKERLKGKGIGDKTIENIRERLIIINQQIPKSSPVQPPIVPKPPENPPEPEQFSKRVRTIKFSKRKIKKIIFRGK